MACIRAGIASTGGSFPREDYLEKYKRCGRRALSLRGACGRRALWLRGACLRCCGCRAVTQLTNEGAGDR